MDMELKVLILDKQPLFIDGICQALHSKIKNYNLSVFGQTKCTAEILSHYEPDFLIFEQSIIQGQFEKVLVDMLNGEKPPQVLILLTEFYVDFVHRMIKLGITGFLYKHCTSEQLIDGMMTLLEGGVVTPPEFMKQMQKGPVSRQMKELTNREREIIHLVARGYSYRDVADCLVISVRTVHFHMNNIMSKMNTTSRLKALIKAKEKGII